MKRITRGRCAGMTLVECLMVVAILVVLGTLLLPAVQASRRSAWRVCCQSHLRQWGMASLGYLAAKEAFPPAATWREGERADRRHEPARHGLFSFLLPYVEQQAVDARIDWNRDWNDPANERWTHLDLGGIFLCPAAPGDRREKHPTDYSTAVSVDPSEATGLGRLLKNQVVRNRSTASGPYWGRGQRVWRGLLELVSVDYVRNVRRQPKVRARDVRDGFSKTILLFENAGKPVCYQQGKLSDCHITRFRWASPTVWMTINDICGDQQLVNCNNNSQPYAFHAAGLNFAFADGSVQFASQEIHPDLFVSQLTRAGFD